MSSRVVSSGGGVVGEAALAFGGGGGISSHNSRSRMNTPLMIGRVLAEPVASSAARVRRPARSPAANWGGVPLPLQRAEPYSVASSSLRAKEYGLRSHWAYESPATRWWLNDSFTSRSMSPLSEAEGTLAPANASKSRSPTRALSGGSA